MTSNNLSLLKRASARLVGQGGSGTGYLISKRHIATCEHVVRNWSDGNGKVYLGPDQVELDAEVVHIDALSDCAIVQLQIDADAQPLPLATSAPSYKELWDGFGFPEIAKSAGLPIAGHVGDPDLLDDRRVPALLLYSPEAAAGNASPLRGFSGTPVLVQGAVVGHFRKHLGDPDDRARAAYGYVYATPIASVRALLGGTKVVEKALKPTQVESLREQIPALNDDQFHAFISYRSTNSGFAKRLATRLEGAGLRVYLAEHELRPGDKIMAGLAQALAASRAAIAMVSEEWLRSPWCKEELDVLTHRAVTDQSFQLIPLRLDNVALPPFLGNRKAIDVDSRILEDEAKSAALIDNLLWGLIGKPKPAAESTESRVAIDELTVAGRFSIELKVAKERDPGAVVKVWREWQASGLSDTSPALQAAEILIGKGRPELALEILHNLNDSGLRAQQLRGLAISKSDKLDEAIGIFTRLREAKHRDPETTGNLAAAYKARSRKTGAPRDFQRAFELYSECFQLNGDGWTGINAANLALRSGNEEAARDLAAKVARNLELQPESDRSAWDWASLAEAYLIDRRAPKASECYKRANSAAGQNFRDLAVMREGARSVLEAQGQARGVLDALFTVPNVVAFVGHRTDPPGREPPRFPTVKVKAVREAIRKRLEALKPVQGFSGLASGADIVFVDELLRLGGYPRVILPIPKDDFRRVSVGGAWSARFDDLIQKVECSVLHDHCPPDAELPELFFSANRDVQKKAIDYAASLFAKVTVIAVWDRSTVGDGIGGTADAVEQWAIEGYDVDVIDVTKV